MRSPWSRALSAPGWAFGGPDDAGVSYERCRDLEVSFLETS
jgi:hypothetical protein